MHARDAGMALAVLLAAATVDAAPSSTPVRNARIAVRPPPRALGLPAAPVTLAAGRSSWAVSLGAVDVRNRNTNAHEKIRLYADDGGIDRAALRAFMRVASSAPNLPDTSSGEVPEPLDPRLVQLAYRSAYHFNATTMVLVSATRKGAHGKHGSGDALDYQLEGVAAAKLAAYIRGYPHAGVGIYTHPKTQYVHVDVRDHSYHWLDGSPPGVTWREKLLGDPTQQKRDASYVKVMDLPEAAANGP